MTVRETAPALLLVLAFVALLAPPLAAEEERVTLASGLRASLDASGGLWLETQPERGEGMLGLARRTTGGTAAAQVIAAANGDRDRLLAGTWYRIPFRLLTPELKVRVARAVFADDCSGEHGWVHRVGGGGRRPASLWRSPSG